MYKLPPSSISTMSWDEMNWLQTSTVKFVLHSHASTPTEQDKKILLYSYPRYWRWIMEFMYHEIRYIFPEALAWGKIRPVRCKNSVICWQLVNMPLHRVLSFYLLLSLFSFHSTITTARLLVCEAGNGGCLEISKFFCGGWWTMVSFKLSGIGQWTNLKKKWKQ